MKDKLGMYFYIREDTWATDTLYQEVMLIKDELTQQWLTVTFSSKDDALSFLQKKIPDVVENFQKFGIDNPLPATLYVMFSTDAQYEAMKTTILKHKDIILNVQDVDIKQQENRILTTINFSNLVVVIAYCIIALILIIVFTFLWFLLKTIFSSLHKEFEVKKLLGASHLDITKSFIVITVDIVIFAFIICGILLILSWITLNIFLTSLFSISLLSVLANAAVLLIAFIIELIVIWGLSIFLAYYFTNKSHKELSIMK